MHMKLKTLAGTDSDEHAQFYAGRLQSLEQNKSETYAICRALMKPTAGALRNHPFL